MSTSLPQPVFATNDPATIEAGLIDSYQTAANRTTGPADPIRPLLSTFAAEVVELRNLINFSALQNLLPWATGAFLDGLVALLNVIRLPAASAVTTLQFTLSAARSSVVTIPAGTRAAVNGVYFATTENLDIPIGSTVGTVIAACTIAGAIGNGYLAGQITQLVDILPWLATVTNTTTSSTGADVETDDALRARFVLALDAYSVAGPSSAYAYWAKTANSAIIDVAVLNPKDAGVTYNLIFGEAVPEADNGSIGDYYIDTHAALLYGPKSSNGWGTGYDIIGSRGLVLIYPLLNGGQLPTTTVLNAVADVLNDDDIRPLTDTVQVLAPARSVYNIVLTYHIAIKDVARETTIQAAVTAAVDAYIAWQSAVLGRDINPSQLIFLIMQAGASSVTIISPEATTVAPNAVAQLGTSSVNYGGLE